MTFSSMEKREPKAENSYMTYYKVLDTNKVGKQLSNVCILIKLPSSQIGLPFRGTKIGPIKKTANEGFSS